MNHRDITEEFWDESKVTFVAVTLCQFCTYCSKIHGDMEAHYYEEHITEVTDISESYVSRTIFELIEKGGRYIPLPNGHSKEITNDQH